MSKKQTLGEYRVGTMFNPSGRADVDYIKEHAAIMIDLLLPIRDQGGEAARCAAIAMTEIESAAMWAVKALTKPPQE